MRIIRRLPALLGALAILLGIGSAAAQTAENRIYLPQLALGSRQSGVSYKLDVTAATHLGGPQADSAAAVDIAPDGTVVFGGVLPGYQAGVAPTTLLGGTSGAVMRLSGDGREVLSLTRIGAAVSDLEVGPDGQIAVCGDFGVATLEADGGRAAWSAAPGAGRRCAIGADGTVGALVGGDAVVYDAAGRQAGRWAVAGAQNDIAVDAANRQVIVTGFSQVSGNLQIPFIRAYSYAGVLRWRSYDFPAGTPNLGSADTRGERIAIGRDGKLYFAGSINGGTGVSIFTRDPKDTSKSAGDRTVVTDKYTNPYNIGSVKMLWVARFNPANGELELAQSLLTRRSGDRGNSIGAGAITADADGTVYIAGGAAAFIADRDRVTVAGVPVGPYGGDAYALALAPDFKQRRLWVAFTGPQGGSGGAVGISVRGGATAMAATVSSGAFISHNPIQAQPGGAADAYLAVWFK